ncbi:MAG: HNH endonuclease signature motif containing protein [Nanoarchaeota archaeon]
MEIKMQLNTDNMKLSKSSILSLIKTIEIQLGDEFQLKYPISIPYSLKNKIIDRDGSKCIFCKCDNRALLDVHHIIPKKINLYLNENEHNLLTVCKNCHALLHDNWKITFDTLRDERNKLIEMYFSMLE